MSGQCQKRPSSPPGKAKKLSNRSEVRHPFKNTETTQNFRNPGPGTSKGGAAETRQVSQMVSRVQAETTAELVAVKRQLQVLRTEFDARLDNSNTNTHVIINELADKMQEHRPEVIVQLERQRESLETVTQVNTQEVNRQVEQLNAKFVGIESRPNETTNRQALALEVCGVGHDFNSPSVRPTSDQGMITEVTEQSSGTVSGTHQSNTCHAVASASSMNDCGVHANRNVNVSLVGYLNNSELPIPQFDDASEMFPDSLFGYRVSFDDRQLKQTMDRGNSSLIAKLRGIQGSLS
jgi:hypothetical protein